MIKLASIALLLILQTGIAFSQKADSKGVYDLAKQMETVKASNNKLSFLNNYLSSALASTTYSKSAKPVRDSVSTRLQLDHQVLLLTIFANLPNKDIRKIKDNTAKVEDISIKWVNDGGYNELQEKSLRKKIDGYVAEINALVEKTGFLRGGSGN